MKKKSILVFIVLLFTVVLSSCLVSDADVASANLSKSAEQFEVYRRVVFYNGITDEYILMIEGFCSVEFYPDKFVVTVKTGPKSFMKHYLGRADNVFPFVEQLDASQVSDSRYKVIFKPISIIPDIDIVD